MSFEAAPAIRNRCRFLGRVKFVCPPGHLFGGVWKPSRLLKELLPVRAGGSCESLHVSLTRPGSARAPRGDNPYSGNAPSFSKRSLREPLHTRDDEPVMTLDPRGLESARKEFERYPQSRAFQVGSNKCEFFVPFPPPPYFDKQYEFRRLFKASLETTYDVFGNCQQCVWRVAPVCRRVPQGSHGVLWLGEKNRDALSRMPSALWLTPFPSVAASFNR